MAATPAERLDAIELLLLRVLARVDLLLEKDQRIMADLTALTAAVANASTVEASAVTLIQGIAAQLNASSTDPAKVKALADQLTQSSAALSAAILANTPAAPPAPAPAA